MHFLSLALCLFVGIICASVPVEDGIFVLTDETFPAFIAENDFSFVEFYAPWCGHCKSLAPVYIEVAKTLKENSANVVLAKVDCTQAKQICAEVQGYPTIKLFSKTGRIFDYDGDRTQEALVSYLNKKTGPPSTRLTTAEELATFLEGPKQKVLAYIDESTEADYLAWKEVASSSGVDMFSFAHADTVLASDKARAIELLAQGKDTLTLRPERAFESVAILDWISEHGFPLVDTLTQETWNRALSHPTSKFLACYFYNKETGSALPSYVEEVANQLRGKVIFTMSDSAQILDRWGGSGKVFPSAVVLDFNTEQPGLFTWDEATGLEMNAETLRSFVDQAIVGTYQTNIKSEEIPAENDEPVKTLVAKNFDQTIADNSKTVILVEFYAPWCGHCKKLAPVLDELGTFFKSNEGVVIAKMDATANTVRKDITVTGFPTILAFQNGVHHPYSGGHDLESLKSFVQSFLTEGHSAQTKNADDRLEL
jgi:protein disulfide isomerase